MKAEISLKVREMRKAQGLTIKDLSQRSGVSISYISELENGKKNISLEVLILLAVGLNTTPEKLYTYRVEN